MKILNVTVVIRSGYNDNISMETDLPSPYLCDRDTDAKLFLGFDCAKGRGIEYVRAHFGIEPEVIEVS